MKIAVTAASGKLGRAIVKRLTKEIGARNVIGIARTPEKAKNLGIEIRKGDYSNKQDFINALNGVDAVLIISGMDHPDKRIEQHRNIIDAAKQNNVKKVVYTSIFGAKEGNAFSPIVASNRQTEKDIQNSGMSWAIGRNGLYIEPDLEYIDNYVKEGAIVNCADEGLCGYTSRNELALAYWKLLSDDNLSGKIYNLFGDPITQHQLAMAINKAYDTNLVFKNISTKEYLNQRKSELGDFLGTVIGGIYEGIKLGNFEGESQFELVSKRPHKNIDEMIEEYKLL